MEISVTVNNGVNKNSRFPSYDPSQYSLKSQSYDRNVDIIVTSESEDYLTVSEDEYSKTGRLANIPEVEANEVFAIHSVRLAYQTPVNTVEDSTETDSEILQSDNNFLASKDNFDVPCKKDLSIDLFRTSEEPVSDKVPRIKLDDIANFTDSPSRSPLLRSDIDQVSPRSPLLRSDIDQVSPRSPLPRSDIDQVSTRSPLPTCDLVHFSPRSHFPRTFTKASTEKTSSLSPPRIDSRSPLTTPSIAHSEIDTINISSYQKRQQIPSNSDEHLLELPYSYPQEFVNHEIPVSDSEATRYNPLYEDSNLSEITDSDSQDIYIPSSRLRSRITKVNKVNIDEDAADSENTEVTVPPPLEFSDSQSNKEKSLVTFIDDNAADENNGAEKQYIPYGCDNNQLREEKIFFDYNSKIKDSDHPDISETDEDAELAFNSELTAPFDIVLQEQGIYEQTNNQYYKELGGDFVEKDPVKVFTNCNNDSVVISKIESKSGNKENNHPVHSLARFYHQTQEENNKMDVNSETMLKSALDMEYDQLSDTEKSESRVMMGHYSDERNFSSGETDFYDKNTSQPVVATNIAKEIIQNEQGGVGYYLESDQEPDAYPDEDAPEDLPDLPPMPPPMLNQGLPMLPNNHSLELNGNNSVNLVINGAHSDIESAENVDVDVDDQNWSLRVKLVRNEQMEINIDDINEIDDQEFILPVKVARKTEISFSNEEKGQEDDEIIIPINAKREYQIPSTFVDKVPSPRTQDKVEDDEEPLITISTKKTPPPLHPKPKKYEPCVEEEAIIATTVKKDNTKELLKVVSVVKALTARARNKDPDVVDKIEKDMVDKPKSLFSALIKVNGKSADSVEMPPPSHEPNEVNKDKIKLTKQISHECSPPNQTFVNEVKEVIRKSIANQNVSEEDKGNNDMKKSQSQSENIKPLLKTSIIVKKTSVAEQSNQEKNPETFGSSSASVPLLNLGCVSDVNHDSLSLRSNLSMSPRSDKSEDPSSWSKYKTTIGVPKPLILEPASEDLDKHVDDKNSKSKEPEQHILAPIKPLSQIKPLSFNPKSLSHTSSRHVQYKTTISTLGLKPGSSLTKTLSASQKGDHPIKRMESMPFEVSILKGILGIGIKTAMTPEGHVKVTEILPNGPIGREGNIKVGDYILSINSTQLTGLTDGKVQQILRLLPRGLSKIVASAVSPDLCGNTSSSGQANIVTKPVPTPQRQASSISSLTPFSARKITIATNPDTSTSTTMKVEPPQFDAKPAKEPASAQISPKKFHGSSSSSLPVKSPKQEISPKTPPPLALKPRKTTSAKPGPENEIYGLSQPIEAELFVSINEKQEITPSQNVGNILPGSVKYDVAESPKQSGWTAGIVSSMNLKNLDTNNEIIGNIDVVHNTNSLSVNDMSTEHCIQEKVDTIEQKHLEYETTVMSLPHNEKSKNDVRDDTSVFTDSHPSRTFSSSSTTSSYHEFTECDVQDEIKPDQVIEEEDMPKSPGQNVEVTANDEYVPDFEDGDKVGSGNEAKDNKHVQVLVLPDSSSEMDCLKTLAEHIVTGVIQSVRESNILADSVNTEGNSDNYPPISSDCPPMSALEPPHILTNEMTPPPLPISPPPIPDCEVPKNSSEENVGLAVSVVDLALYPDSDQSSEGMADNKAEYDHTEVHKVVNVVDLSVNCDLHAETPITLNNADSANHDNYNLNINVESYTLIDIASDMNSNISESVVDQYTLSQVTGDAKDLESEPNFREDNIIDEDLDEVNVSNVISMYSQLEKSFEGEMSHSIENDINNKTNNNNTEKESVGISDKATCDMDSVSNGVGINSKENNVVVLQENKAVVTDPCSQNGHTELDNQFKDSNKQVNSVADVDTSPRYESDSGSPKLGRKYSSRVDEILSHTEDIQRGKYSEEVDKMIKMFSTEEPVFVGEAEILNVTISKGVTGLGFIIQGGKASPKGDQPITVKRIFKGGPADGILQVQDEILSVNNEALSDMSHSEARNHLKFLPSGENVMKVRRYISR